MEACQCCTCSTQSLGRLCLGHMQEQRFVFAGCQADKGLVHWMEGRVAAACQSIPPVMAAILGVLTKAASMFWSNKNSSMRPLPKLACKAPSVR